MFICVSVDMQNIRKRSFYWGVPPRFPDQEENTIAKGHSLRPRFVTYADSDFPDVVAALGKTLRRLQINK